MVATLHLLGALTTLCVGAFAMPSHTKINDAATAKAFFTKYGYLDPQLSQSGALLSEDVFRNTIMEFQAFAGLDQTGELDEETLMMMNTPRCGVKDKDGFRANARSSRYSLHGSRWKTKTLTYRITKYPRELPMKDVDREIKAAFQVWQDVTDLTFEYTPSGKVHIEIRFERGDHGDGEPFDGRGGTLAHAYFPIYGGDAHFDDSEAWTINSYRGTNLFQVAAHEFGHSLGLEHSHVRSALMYPAYLGYQSDFKLDRDDIAGIRALYGKKSKPTPAARRSDPGCSWWQFWC